MEGKDERTWLLYRDTIIIIWWFKTTSKHAGVKVLKGDAKEDERNVLRARWWKLQACATWTCMGSARREEFFSHLLMTPPTATRLRLTIIIQLWRVTCTSSGVYRNRGGMAPSFLFRVLARVKPRSRDQKRKGRAWIIRDKLNRFITVQIAKSQALIIADAWQLFLRELIEELCHWTMTAAGNSVNRRLLLKVQ